VVILSGIFGMHGVTTGRFCGNTGSAGNNSSTSEKSEND
jgi:hypothetical protein